MMKMDLNYEEDKYFNFAIEDDRRQDYLAAKNFIWVDEIPDDLDLIDSFVQKLLASTQ